MDSVQLDPVPQRIALLDEFVADHTEILSIETEERSSHLTGQVKLNGDLIFQMRNDFPGVPNRNIVVADSSDRQLFDLVEQSWPCSTYAAKSLNGKTVLKVNGGGLICCGPWRSEDTATFASTTGTKHVLKLLRTKPSDTNFDSRSFETTYDTKWHDINFDIVDSSTGAVVARMHRLPDHLAGGAGQVIVAPGVDKVLIGMVAICCYELNDPYFDLIC